MDSSEARRRVESFLNLPVEEEDQWFWDRGIYVWGKYPYGGVSRMRWYNRPFVWLRMKWRQRGFARK